MITAGIDCGAKTIKVVVLKDGKVAGKSLVHAGIDAKIAVEKAFEEATTQAGVAREDIHKVISTGAGRDEVLFRAESVTEVGADAKGAVFMYPTVRTVIDVGAEEGRAIRVDERGKVVDFAINEKCAAERGPLWKPWHGPWKSPWMKWASFR